MMLNPSEIACKRQINKLRYTSCDLELGNLAKLIILENRFGRKMMKYPILVHEFSFNKIKTEAEKSGYICLIRKASRLNCMIFWKCITGLTAKLSNAK